MNLKARNIVEANNLTIIYPSTKKTILKNFNLKIYKNQHTAIIGESGCGKSTFAKSLVQMLPLNTICEGDLIVDNNDLRKISKKELKIFRRTKIGFIYQDSIQKLNPLMTIGNHLYELLKIHLPFKSKKYISQIVQETFDKVGIETNRLQSFPHEFSGGMRQRVCIALAIALKPKLLIADEPTTSLDSNTSYEIMNQILSLCNQNGSTLILISHDINLAAKWCKKIAIINNGAVMEEGDIKNVLSSPQSIIGKKLVRSSLRFLKSDIQSYKDEDCILEVTNLRYWFKLNSSLLRAEWKKAINEVSFKLFRNETLGIVGKSGSGKSTLGKALVGLINKRGGEIKFLRDYSNIKGSLKINKAKNIQMIFQDPFSSLNPKMNIKNILNDVYSIHKGESNTKMYEERDQILSKLNLPNNHSFLNSYPHQLSGGQLQRISIARALLIQPKILICDESVNMLDACVKIEILHLLRQLQIEMNLTIIFITHDLGLAKRFCNRLLVISNGAIVEEGQSQEIFTNPKHKVTKNLIKSSLNIT